MSTETSMTRHPNMAIRYAPAVSDFPWYNGILLTTGSMQEEIKELISEKPNVSEGELIIIQKVAENWDHFDIDKSNISKRLIAFTRSYFETEIADLVNPHQWERSNSSDLIVATHTLLSFGLLDRLTDAVGLTPNATLSKVPRSTLPDLPEKFTFLLRRIEHWNKPIQEAISARKSFNAMVEIHEDQLFANPMPEELSPEQKSLVTSVKMFSRASKAFQDSKWNNILFNFEMMAFAISWYGQGHRVNVGADEPEWANEFISRAADVGLPLQEAFINQLKDENLGGIMYNHMRNMFHMCVAISPIFCLLSRSFVNAKISRDKVIAASIAYGNDRPDGLAEVERSIWRGLMRVALGSDAQTEVDHLLRDYEQIMQSATPSGLSLEWYSTKVVIAGPVSSDSGPSHVTPSTRPSSPLSSLTPSPPHPTRRSKRLEQVQRGDEVITASDGKRVHGVKRRNEKSSAEDRAEDRADEAPEQEEDTEDTPRQGEEEKDRQSLSGNGSDNLSLRARKLRLIMGTEGGRKKGPFPHISIMEPDLDFGKDDVSEYPAPKIEQTGITLKLFGAMPEDPPVEHTYRAPTATAFREYPALTQVLESVEKLYVDGTPLHHLPSAREATYDPKASSIFIVQHDVFEDLSDKEIQRIFRHRHILVRGTPGKPLKFDASGLSTLAPLHKRAQFQVAELRGAEGHEDLLRVSTLGELLKAASGSERRILNGLDFPLTHLSRPPPPRFSSLASHEVAIHYTKGVLGFPPRHTAGEELHWGLAATEGATSMVHIDDDGLATAVKIMSGSKWWVLMRRKRDALAEDEVGDLTSMKCFPLSWEVGNSGHDMFEAEAIHLRETDVLYMRPNTPHYVLGVENCITHGSHFYSASTIADTCCAIVHTFILNATLTNQAHDETRALLRRMMAMWMSHYAEGIDEITAHVPDISTATGFLDLVLLGCVMEFSDALSRRHYLSGVPKDLVTQEHRAQWMFRSCVRRLDSTHVALIRGNPVSIMYIVRRYLLQFATVLCGYIKRWDTVEVSSLFDADRMGNVVTKHLLSQWSEIYPRFQDIKEQDPPAHTSFAWDGPTFEIQEKGQLPAWMNEVAIDWAEDPVFLVERDGDGEEELTERDDGSDSRQGSDVAKGKRRERDPASAQSPPASPEPKRRRNK